MGCVLCVLFCYVFVWEPHFCVELDFLEWVLFCLYGNPFRVELD